jgi:predicted small secreted protein
VHVILCAVRPLSLLASDGERDRDPHRLAGMGSAEGMRMKTQSSALKFTAILGIVLGALAFSGCHTMDGAGRDIEKAGEKIQDAADK